MSPEEKEEILKLYQSGMQQQVIAQKFGRAKSSVHKFIKTEMEKLKDPEEVLFDHLDYYRF